MPSAIVSVSSDKDYHGITKLVKLIKAGNVCVLYYATWCGYCQQFQPEWKRFTQQPRLGFKVAEVESKVVPRLKELIGSHLVDFQGYPTVSMYNNGRKLGDYEGERTVAAMTNNLNTTFNNATQNNKTTITAHPQGNAPQFPLNHGNEGASAPQMLLNTAVNAATEKKQRTHRMFDVKKLNAIRRSLKQVQRNNATITHARLHQRQHLHPHHSNNKKHTATHKAMNKALDKKTLIGITHKLLSEMSRSTLTELVTSNIKKADAATLMQFIKKLNAMQLKAAKQHQLNKAFPRDYHHGR